MLGFHRLRTWDVRREQDRKKPGSSSLMKCGRGANHKYVYSQFYRRMSQFAEPILSSHSRSSVGLTITFSPSSVVGKLRYGVLSSDDRYSVRGVLSHIFVEMARMIFLIDCSSSSPERVSFYFSGLPRRTGSVFRCTGYSVMSTGRRRPASPSRCQNVL